MFRLGCHSRALSRCPRLPDKPDGQARGDARPNGGAVEPATQVGRGVVGAIGEPSRGAR
jgi:hypothetical protein